MSVMTMATSLAQIDKIGTGFPTLDRVLDGGFPVGHISVIAGPPDSAKSALALYALALWGGGVYVDSDGHSNPDFMNLIGAVPFVVLPGDLESVDYAVSESLQLGEFVVLDSVPSLVVSNGQFSLFGEMVRNWKRLASANDGTLLIVDQYRHRVGFGNKNRSCFAPVLAPLSSLYLRFDAPGISHVHITVAKDVHHPQPRRVTLDIDNRFGLSLSKSRLMYALESGEISQSGSWYIAGGQKFHGEKEVLKWLS